MLNITDITWIKDNKPSTELGCPICGKIDQHHQLLSVPHMQTKKQMYLYQCSACDARFYPDAVESSYDDTNAASDAFLQHYLEAGAGLWEMFSPLARVYRAPESHLLDIGCGFGFSVDMWKNILGQPAIGVETAEWGQIGRSQLGIPIFKGMLDDIASLQGQAFNIVYACEVIEHVANPWAFLKSLSSRVKATSGTLVLTTPNGDFISEGNDEKDILAALLPGGHLFLLSARALEQLLTEFGFPHVHVVSARERLIAYASHEPIDLTWSEQEVRHQYIGYLRQRLEKAAPGTPFYDGFAYRLFKELVALGDIENAHSVKESLRKSMSLRFDATDTPSAWVAYSQEIDGFEQWAKKLPFFIGSYCFFRGELARISGKDKTEALAWLTASIEITLASLKITPLFFTEAIHLMWAAMARSILLHIEAGSTVDALKMFELMSDARSGKSLKFYGTKPELSVVLDSALVLLPHLIGANIDDDNSMRQYHTAINHALTSASTDEESIAILQTLSKSLPDFLLLLENGVADPLTDPPSLPLIEDLEKLIQERPTHQNELLRSTVTKLRSHVGDIFFTEALARHQAGNYDEAATIYGKALGIASNHYSSLANLSIIHLQQGHLHEGIRLIELSLAINPNQPEVLYNYGNLLHRLKHWDKALANYERAIALYPNYTEARRRRDEILEEMGSPEITSGCRNADTAHGKNNSDDQLK